MMFSARPTIYAAVLGMLALTGCGQPSRPRASSAVLQKCRVEVDRVYSAQNRVDLSTRDTRDTPFASNYVSGITSSGLGAQYGRDNLTQSCINEATTGSAASAGGVASTGPTFGTTPSSAARPGAAP